jgi:serine/threonine protein kinase
MTVKPGQSLGQYRITEQIGRGGMATVYRATQPSLSRQVAIKVLPEFFAEDKSFHERFRQEAMAVASLRHPNILTVFDSGEAEGVAYIVTELVDGGTLADKLGKPLPIEQCIDIVKAVASALDYAHSRGVIHRDVKPGNILLTRDGTPILSDFGLARMMGDGSQDAATRLTLGGNTVGTPEYMAPEQVSSSDVTPSADIYSLAIIVYEMLTGTLPYSGDSALVVIMARLRDPLPLPRERNPDIPEAVQEVLLKGLAKEPTDRYSTAGEMVRALEAASLPAPVLSQPAIAAIPATAIPAPAISATAIPATIDQPVAARKSRVPTLAIVAGVVGLVAVVLVVTWMRSRTPLAPASSGDAAAVATAPAHPDAATRESATIAATPATVPAPSNSAPAVAPADKPVSSKATGGDGLPPHGRLLYSLGANPSDITASQQQDPKDTIEAKDGAVEFSA